MGTYGFMVNVMREFLTVLFLPFIVKISKGSPIASGAAGNMDTMLVPVTKFVGPELGLVTLVTGTILTFAVPFILPMLYNLFLWFQKVMQYIDKPKTRFLHLGGEYIIEHNHN